MININNRLKKVSSFVDCTSSGVIDVGCDHALLDIYLLEKLPKLRVIASDINDGPLKKAKENLIKFHLDNKIELIKADGIESIKDYVDTIIISGMGAETILGILNKDESKLNNVKKLIISSNNKYLLLRKNIINLGFKINRECVVYEDGKFYIIIEFIRGNENYIDKELYFGPYLLKHKDDLFYQYYNYVKRKKIDVLNMISLNNKKREEIELEIELLTSEL